MKENENDRFDKYLQMEIEDIKALETRHLEQEKAANDYLKHMTTLSTGCIIILGTFLEKVFKSPGWKILIGISIISFLIVIISSLTTKTLVVAHMGIRGSFGKRFDRTKFQISWTSLIITWAAFLIGIICTAIFVIKNI